MNALYNLREMLCSQLEEYGERGELSNSVLEKVDTLAHAIKNLDKVIECYDNEDSGNSWNRSSRRSYRYGNSFGRGGRAGRRARDGHEEEEFVDKLYSMMEETDDEEAKQSLQRIASRMDQK